jgi:hypothetical protein
VDFLVRRSPLKLPYQLEDSPADTKIVIVVTPSAQLWKKGHGRRLGSGKKLLGALPRMPQKPPSEMKLGARRIFTACLLEFCFLRFRHNKTS